MEKRGKTIERVKEDGAVKRGYEMRREEQRGRKGYGMWINRGTCKEEERQEG